MELVVAGVDEVGRGCLAGPVYAAAVILPKPCRLPGLNDSKKLPREERERLAPLIEQRALAFAVASASVEEIDRMNILRASLLAMQRAVTMLALKPTMCLVDGNQPPPLECEVQTVIGGDGRHRCIMAASVLAKVARDAELRRLDLEFPGYGFAQHKGYATPEHQLALRRLGPCGIHRMSFAPCAQGSFDFGEFVPDDEGYDPAELGVAVAG
jgi:ribonuclease HII